MKEKKSLTNKGKPSRPLKKIMLTNALKEKLHTSSPWKEIIASSLVILFCLIFFTFLPANDSFQKFFRGLVFLLIVPFLYVRLTLKRDIFAFGFGFSPSRNGVLWMIGIFILSLFGFLILIKFTNFKDSYLIAESIKNNFTTFIFYEFVAFNFFFLLQEFFFKGFVLFSFTEKFKAWSVLITAAIYCLSLLATQNFSWQTAPLIAWSFGGSIVAYKNNSFWLAYLTGFVFMLLLDSFLIYISK